MVKAADRLRRRRVRTYAITGALLAVLAAFTVGTMWVKDSQQPGGPLAAYGVSSDQAGCRPLATGPAAAPGVHVGPGTAQPDGAVVDYPVVPPASGPHLAVPVFPNLPFYSVQDVPRVESLVHNLEHGYTILWYDPALPEADRDLVRDLAGRVRVDVPKFIAAPWDTTRGPLPSGARVALTHWGATSEYRLLCARVSGQVVADFVAAHPAADSPYPDAA